MRDALTQVLSSPTTSALGVAAGREGQPLTSDKCKLKETRMSYVNGLLPKPASRVCGARYSGHLWSNPLISYVPDFR